MGRDDSMGEDPGVAPVSGREPPERVFYDGECGFCHATVRFVVRRDRRAVFRFAPLGGTTIREHLDEARRRSLPDSVVVLASDGRLLVRSAAALHLLHRLGGGWGRLARALDWVPTPVADAAYRLLARLRRGLARRPQSQCPMLPPDLRTRFDP